MAVLAIATVGGFLGDTVGLSFGTGFALFGSLAEMLLAPHPKKPTFKAGTSAWGTTWPLTYNHVRVPGQLIQAGSVNFHSSKNKKNGGSWTQTIAIGFCEGEKQILRIWADNTCIYDNRPITNPPAWTANTDYSAGDYVLPTAGGKVQFIATVDGTSGSTEPSWNTDQYNITRDGSEAWQAYPYVRRKYVGKQYKYNLVIYTGDESQLPDSALQETIGASHQPGYRGLVYIVLESFDLGRYGNRIPNFEAEVTEVDAFAALADFYGAQGGHAAALPTEPFLEDSAGNIYYQNNDGIVNIEALSYNKLYTSSILADAVAFGYTGGVSTAFEISRIAGKYFIASAWHLPIGGGVNWIVVLYEVNDDGTFTALGCRQYEIGGGAKGDWFTTIATSIRTDTQEIMVAFGDTGSEDIYIAVLDSILGMTGGYETRAGAASRVTGISEISGSYSAAPKPWLGYAAAFVGNDFYVCLNKGHMDWLAANTGGIGYNSFYKSLQPTYPNGVMLKMATASDGAGNITYVYDGPSNDFGWPFSDEGKNLAGSAGQTDTATYDCWGPPLQSQTTDGTIESIIFTRGYSDAQGKVGFKEFDSGLTLQSDESDLPYTNSAGYSYIDSPFVQNISGSYYLVARYGSDFYAKLGGISPSLLTLADICADISGRVGHTSSQYDYSGLSSVVPKGAVLLERGTARSFLEAMQPAYFYDLVDVGSKVVGSLRSDSSTLLTIPETDLAASTDATKIVDRLSSVRSPDLEIPRDMEITYYDYLHDYQQGSQPAKLNKITSYSSGRNTVSVPVVLTPGEAANAATRSLYLLWQERETKKLSVPLSYLQLTPADTINVERGSRTHAVRVTKASLDPTNFMLSLDGCSEDTGIYSVSVPASASDLATEAYSASTIVPIAPPTIAVMDIPALQASDLDQPGIYAASAPNAADESWDSLGVDLLESSDDSVYSTVSTLTSPATMGAASNALGDCARWTVFDETNYIDVTFSFGIPAAASDAALIDNFTNLCWLSTGELFQFGTVSLNSDGSYRLSHLLRGRMGTEHLIGLAIGGETVVVLDRNTMTTVSYSASEIGATRYWEGSNDSVTNNGLSGTQQIVMTTRRLMPPSPYYIKGSRDGSGNLTITGLRRMRWRGQPLWSPPETDTPVTLEIDILSGSTVLRTLSSTLTANGSGITDASGFTAYYAAADQVADFGSNQSSISLDVYALNAIVGRGYPGSATV